MIKYIRTIYSIALFHKLVGWFFSLNEAKLYEEFSH